MIHRSPDNPIPLSDDAKKTIQISEPSNNSESDRTDKTDDEITAEILEHTADYELESLISSAELVNAGNNGLIFKIEFGEFIELAEQKGELPERLKKNSDKASGEDGEIQKKSIATKILKIYKAGMGRCEYVMQKKAHDVIDGAPNKDELASIPKPILFKELSISGETQELLNQKGASLSDNKAEIILMDFLEAKDLATMMYQWVIDNHPNQALNPGSHQSIEEMQQTIAMLLGFERPGGKSADENERALEEKKVFASNADKLYRFLQKSGFKMNPSITSQVKNTLDLLHRNGIYHNDPHERNIMIQGDFSQSGGADSAEASRAFIVDFGSAAGEKIEGRVDDGYLINRLKELTDSPEEIRRKDAMEKLEMRINTMKKSSAWATRYENLSKKIQTNTPSALEQEFSFALLGEDKLDEFIAALIQLSEDGFIGREEIIGFINEKTKPIPLPTGRKKQAASSLPPWVRNKLSIYKSLF